MSQNRKPPAYMEYAATVLAQIPFRSMSLQERGLFYTMRLECWVNKNLPSDPLTMSKILGLSADEVAISLPAVMKFFKIEGDFIICPELEDYRSHLEERKHKQSQGGKTGSAITNKKRKVAKEIANEESSNNPSSTLSSNSQVPRRGSDESLVKSSTVKLSQVQSIKEKDSSVDSFIKDYEEYEAKEEKDALDNGNNEFVRF
ncbi:hypothetical protein [Nitrosomonas ureae]|uniref:Uncharacterized conserved protein YdaU, DUF1376 family n=1 Tax=Nitrosomonas ureae TaxID=44577 RepID=A0A1H2ER36_9PROT|nr:hypothetical protein [Nitrosomonas ureae]ALQ51858.1 hypothetical protein ATY38_11905 [Nitrosomonas ureae]SDT97551.1 Uncharacterized conserved protein YdaU, DUF1376 family [Nitrosomonas ureae]